MSSIHHSDLVEVGEDGAIIRIQDLLDGWEHIVYAQYNGSPLSNSHPAFRVKIVQLGKDASIGIGIISSPIVQEINNDEEEQKSSDRSRDALMFHSDNGAVSTPNHERRRNESSSFGEGDVITLVIEQLTAYKSLVCVWKNDKIQCRQWVTIRAENLYPTINAWWGPAELQVEWLSSTVPQLSMTNLNQWMSSSNMKVEGDKLSVSDDKKGIIQSPCAFQEGSSMYFETSLESMGECEADEEQEGPLIGLTSSTWSGHEGLPGKSEYSIAYDTAKGKILNGGHASKGKNLGETGKCKAGDRIGCGLLLFEADKATTATQMVVVYFTRNQSVVHHCNVTQSTGGFYPTCAFVSKGSSVRLNMTASVPALPDKTDWLAKAKRALDFPGLGSFEASVERDENRKHEEGVTQGYFRFSEPVGCPTSDVIKPQSELNDGKLLQLLKTITPSEPYFTIKIEELDDGSAVCVGVSRGGQSCGSIPGSLIDSAGYGSQGEIFMGSDGHFAAEKFKKGDVIGVNVQFLDLTKVVQFIKNGSLMGQSIIKGSNKDIYPSLGFRGLPATVHVTWPSARPDPPPTFSKDNFENWLKSPGILMNGSRLCCEKKTRELKSRILVSPQPLCHAWSYYEVQINCKKLSTDSQKVLKAPTIGLTNCMRPSKYKHIINNKEARDTRYYCHTNSIGYMDYLKHEMLPVKRFIASGDRIGWGLMYPASSKNIPSDLTRQIVIVYCCINGEIVYHKPMEQPGGGLYPVVTLYRYGEEASLLIDQTPPRFPDMLSWYEEADAFKMEVDKQRKAAEFVLYLPYLMRTILPSKQKFRRGQYKQTSADRRARPATPCKRPDNHLKRNTVYIHCDSERYNEATHIQARLDTKGLVTRLLPEDKLNSSDITSLIDDHVSSCTSVVCCMGPEISQTKHMGKVLDLAQKRSKPVLPFILESVKWPPEGSLQKEWQKLVMHKIETSGDFDWAIEQIEEKTLNLKDKGYNGKEIRVVEGKGAKMLYSDAQKGNKTINESSDPNALKKAIADADRHKLQSIGSDDFPETNGGGDRGATGGGGRSFSFTSLKEPKKTFDDGPRRPHSSHGGRVNQSKTCIIL
eukprot:XP_011672355.1 PREDICTED: uncharacterized protein LOC577229 isoform X1 [Strongylocentrotus purpuratus]